MAPVYSSVSVDPLLLVSVPVASRRATAFTSVIDGLRDPQFDGLSIFCGKRFLYAAYGVLGDTDTKTAKTIIVDFFFVNITVSNLLTLWDAEPSCSYVCGLRHQ